MADLARGSRIFVGWTLVFGPIAVLAGVHAITGSAVMAAVMALSASPTLQILAEMR